MRDDSGFEALVVGHAGAIRAYVYRRVAPDAVDDIIAETFAAAWRKRASLPEHVRPWLYRAAANAIAEHHRKAGRRARHEQAAAAAATVEDATTALIDQVVLRDALARLDPDDAEVLRLAYWEDLTSRDIALVLGCTPGAVRVRLHRARGRLAELLPDFSPAHTEGAQR